MKKLAIVVIAMSAAMLRPKSQIPITSSMQEKAKVFAAGSGV
jgi:hypothetical protein